MTATKQWRTVFARASISSPCLGVTRGRPRDQKSPQHTSCAISLHGSIESVPTDIIFDTNVTIAHLRPPKTTLFEARTIMKRLTRPRMVRIQWPTTKMILLFQ